MPHSFQIISHTPAPSRLTRQDLIETLISIAIPYGYLVWRHQETVLTGLLASAACGVLFIVGKYLFRHYPSIFRRYPHSTLTVLRGRLYFTEGDVTRWSIPVRDLVRYETSNTDDYGRPLHVIRLHTATDQFAFPQHRFTPEDIAALLTAIGLNPTAAIHQPAEETH